MKYKLLFLTLSVLFCCCKGNIITDTVDCEYHISPLQYGVVSGVEAVDELVDTLWVIRPEVTDQSLLGQIKKILVTPQNEFIILDKSGVYHFGRDGHFIRAYGRQGRAPHEYIALTDIGLDCSADVVYVLDGMNKILIFDITTGAFKKSIVPDWGEESISLDGIIPQGDGAFYVFSVNPTYMKSESDYYALHKFDKKTRKMAECLPNTDFIIGLGALSCSFDNKYLVRPLDNRNIIHEIAPDYIKPLFWIDFGDMNAPQGAIYNNMGEVDLPNYFSSAYCKNPSYFQQTADHIFFIYAGPNYESTGVLFSKRNNKGVRFQASDKTTIPSVFLASDSLYMYGVVNKYSDEGLESRADPITKYIVSKTGFIGLEENPRIVAVKFK